MKPLCVFVAILTLALSAVCAAHPLPADGDRLFRTDRVWEVRLSFTPDQWSALEPRRSERGGFPFGGGPRGFGPGMFLGPAWMTAGDTDKNGKLSEAEFLNLGETWFRKWDTDHTGKLSGDNLREGLDQSVGGPGGPGRPGGRGGRGGFGFQPPKPIKGFATARHESVAAQLKDPKAGRRLNAGFGPGGPGGGGAGEPGQSFLRGQEGKRTGLSSAIGLEFSYVRGDMEFAGNLFRNVAVRYKGNGTYMQSQGGVKRSFKVDLNELVKGQKLAGETKLNLHNNVTDASGMNETLAHRLYRDAGVPAPRTSFAQVYLSVPGIHTNTYAGLYSIVENVDTHFVQARYKTRKGALLKPVTTRPFEYFGDDWAKYKQAYDAKTDLTDTQIQRILALCKLVSRADDATFAAGLGDYLDLDEFARFLSVTVWISTLDSILGVGQNYLVYLNPKSDKFEFIPWDLDHAFGQFGMQGSQEEREQLSIREPWTGDIRLLQRVMKVDAFQKKYFAALQELQDRWAQPERLSRQVDELAALLAPAVRQEGGDKLRRFEQVVAGKPGEPVPFGGPGGAGRPGGPGEPGEPGGFGRGNFLASAFLTAMDADKDGKVSQPEFRTTMAAWFAAWDKSKSGELDADQLREGINADLSPFRGGPLRAP